MAAARRLPGAVGGSAITLTAVFAVYALLRITLLVFGSVSHYLSGCRANPADLAMAAGASALLLAARTGLLFAAGVLQGMTVSALGAMRKIQPQHCESSRQRVAPNT